MKMIKIGTKKFTKEEYNIFLLKHKLPCRLSYIQLQDKINALENKLK